MFSRSRITHSATLPVPGLLERNSQIIETTPFQPTAEQVEQSRLNALESAEMARWEALGLGQATRVSRVLHSIHNHVPHTSHTASGGRIRRASMTNAISRVLSSEARRRTSVVSVVRTSQIPTTTREVSPQPLLPSSDVFARETLRVAADNRAREIRMLEPKYDYTVLDDLRMQLEATRLTETLAGSSPSAIYVSSRQIGPVLEVAECHGFCYGAPVNVRIAAFPVYDDDISEDKPSLLSKINLTTAFSRERTRNRWSRICIATHASVFLCPAVPFERMLKLNQSHFINKANSGDLLLEGCAFDSRSQYIQYKTNSITSHVSVIYRDPLTGLLYALTSRKWSRDLKRLQARAHCFEDLSTFTLINGVQMHPLEDYVREQRKRGVYFVYRRLQRVRKRLDQAERIAIGQVLLEWYGQNHGTSFPSTTEQRLRISEKDRARSGKSLSKVGSMLMESKSFTPSQTVLLALQHAGILSSKICRKRAILSSPGYFEMKGIEYVPDQAAQTFKYESMSHVTGNMHYSSSTFTSSYIATAHDTDNVRFIDTGAV